VTAGWLPQSAGDWIATALIAAATGSTSVTRMASKHSFL
jgi:hypothetical protein